jgi:eukaryotic-like serine/threonine-protein kinase
MLTGQRLGPYEVLGKLGEGGMGEVYRARHLRLGREAAVKVVSAEFASDPQRLRRLEREARAASALNHPAIVTIYDVAEHEGTAYIAMELVEGVTLGERLADGPLDTAAALRLALSLADGLSRAHDAGILHRDLKPDNVMITRNGSPKILDFGVARHITQGVGVQGDLTTRVATTVAGAVLGTVPYMSPEQATGHPVDHHSDQFSFGVVLYEMLSGRRPFQGASAATVLSAILRDAPAPLRTVRREVPRSLEAIVERCLQKDPARRYASTTDLHEALQRCEEGWLARRRFTPDRRTLATAAAVVAVLGGVTAWIALRNDVVRWMERDTLAEVDRLSEMGALYDAFRFAVAVQARIPDDPEVRRRIERITLPISIVTDPPGAEVQIKGYGSPPDAPWVRLGETPLMGVRVPYALTHWRIAKAGFVPFVGAPLGERPFAAFAQGFVLDPEGARPDDMVRVPGGPYVRMGFPPVTLTDYWIDRYEVTNRQFKAFVDAGGYHAQEYWTEPFVEDGRMLLHEQAMARFVDATGQPGPAAWELGTYAGDTADHPVGGVSWYEAAAYCRAIGRRLPTLFHWSAATVQDQASDIVRVSNFGREGPAPVGSHPGLSDFGAYDMAGNVKEWTWNQSGTGRFILGGSWDDPTYMFRVNADIRQPLSRDVRHGFRCALMEGPLDEALLAPLAPEYLAGGAQPVNDQVFNAYRGMYAYDPRALEATVESVDDSSPHWRKETVAFTAAYGNERVLAHLFLPRNAEPPYQAVVWFPGNDAFFLPAGDALASSYLFDFLPRSGRALVYPVYKGMYERRIPFSFAPHEWRDMIVLWSKDLSRTLDYLEERPDIDAGTLGYYGFSAGAIYGPIFTAVDARFRASVLLAGGALAGPAPEANVVNFAPRASVPTLMINGVDDFLTPYEQAQRPLFRLLGAPEERKRHVRLEGGHVPHERLALIREVLAWFDRHLGPVLRDAR